MPHNHKKIALNIELIRVLRNLLPPESVLVEAILQRCGYKLTPVADGHLCCGAAGTYTLLQAKLSQQLLKNKLDALHAGKPEIIASANVGCQMHLASASDIPVKHWIELLEKG